MEAILVTFVILQRVDGSVGQWERRGASCQRPADLMSAGRSLEPDEGDKYPVQWAFDNWVEFVQLDAQVAHGELSVDGGLARVAFHLRSLRQPL